MLLRCKTCNNERGEEYFYQGKNNGKVYFNTKRCKVCMGFNTRDKSKFKPVMRCISYDKRKLYLTLLRLEINNGLATERDMMNLVSCYNEIYGNSIPFFTIQNDSLVYMWEKLKELKKVQ